MALIDELCEVDIFAQGSWSNNEAGTDHFDHASVEMEGVTRLDKRLVTKTCARTSEWPSSTSARSAALSACRRSAVANTSRHEPRHEPHVDRPSRTRVHLVMKLVMKLAMNAYEPRHEAA